LYEDFRTAVQRILTAQAGEGGLVPIPVIRRMLAEQVTYEEFDRMLCALQRDGLVHLLTHVDFGQLSDEERRGCVEHPSGIVVYWACWA
jgi:hypothetical protein